MRLNPGLSVLMLALTGCAVCHAQSGSPAPTSTTSATSKAAANPGAATKDGAAKSATLAKPELKDATTPRAAGSPASTVPEISLKDVLPVSTEDVSRKLALELLKPKSAAAGDANAVAGTNPNGSDKAPVDGVAEFHAAPKDDLHGASTASAAVTQKSSASRVHGELYGANGGTGHATGESVGAKSKTGKTSVFVQSGQQKSVIPPSQ